MFVAEGFDGTGVGDALLDALITTTTEPLEVSIFARNPVGRGSDERLGVWTVVPDYVPWVPTCCCSSALPRS